MALLPIDQVEKLYEQTYWEDLNPNLHVADEDFMDSVKPIPFSDEELDEYRRLIQKEGYIHVPPQNWQTPLKVLADAITSMVDNGLPPVLCFMYDEVWLYAQQMELLFQKIFDNDYKFLSDFWAWFVDPVHYKRGFKPHRDMDRSAIFDDNMPKLVSVWVPVTDATPMNGCIYLLPADKDPYFFNDDMESYDIIHKPGIFDLRDIRALPAEAGSVLIWSQTVYHWGAAASDRATDPRISFAWGVQSGKVDPFYNLNYDIDQVCDFHVRLSFIAGMFMYYNGHYKHDEEFSRFTAAFVDGVNTLQNKLLENEAS